MARTLFFRMVLRKSSEITNNKPIFSQYNIFYNYEYFLFQFAFWSLFNHLQRSQSNQEQCSLLCNWPCFLVLLCTYYGPLQCFSTYFRKLKETGVLCYFLWLCPKTEGVGGSYDLFYQNSIRKYEDDLEHEFISIWYNCNFSKCDGFTILEIMSVK